LNEGATGEEEEEEEMEEEKGRTQVEEEEGRTKAVRVAAVLGDSMFRYRCACGVSKLADEQSLGLCLSCTCLYCMFEAR